MHLVKQNGIMSGACNDDDDDNDNGIMAWLYFTTIIFITSSPEIIYCCVSAKENEIFIPVSNNVPQVSSEH